MTQPQKPRHKGGCNKSPLELCVCLSHHHCAFVCVRACICLHKLAAMSSHITNTPPPTFLRSGRHRPGHSHRVDAAQHRIPDEGMPCHLQVGDAQFARPAEGPEEGGPHQSQAVWQCGGSVGCCGQSGDRQKEVQCGGEQ